jgi:hypothetical protein
MFWDVFRIEEEAQKNGIGLTFEYRFYPGFNTHFIKKGFLSYYTAPDQKLELGVTQVPFGMLPILGNSWWFQLPYYVGLEDDYDTGIKYRWENGPWTFHLAYFLMAEPRGVSEPDFGSFASARYSYDIIPKDGYNGNKERNQGNFRVEYQHDKTWSAGFSAEAGQVYNSVAESSSGRYALAAHAQINLNPRMNIKLQALTYDHPGILNDEGTEEVNYVDMGAYGFGTYEIAARANMYSVGLSYNLPLDWGPVESLTFYEDYSYMQKYGQIDIDGVSTEFVNSQHNVLGFLVTAGHIYTYFDIASGINQPWLSSAFGGTSLSAGRGEDATVPPGGDFDRDPTNGTQANQLDSSPPWNTRFNINIGYYF